MSDYLLKITAGVVIGAASPFIIAPILGAVGFSSAGVVAGSLAAGY